MKADPIWLSMPVIYPWVWVCGWCWCVHARPIQTLACRPSEWSEHACMAVMSRLLRLVHLVPGLQPYSPCVLPILHCPAWKLHFLAVGILANQPSPVVSHTHEPTHTSVNTRPRTQQPTARARSRTGNHLAIHAPRNGIICPPNQNPTRWWSENKLMVIWTQAQVNSITLPLESCCLTL